MRFLPFWFAGGISLIVVLPLFTILAMLWMTALTKPRNEAEFRRKEAQEAIAFMNGALQRGKLHRRVDRACGVLLEECARHWARVQDALSAPFWQDRDLPLHWKQIRDSSRAAADRAMDDIVVILKPVLESRQPQSGVHEIVGDLLESVFNVQTDGPIEPLPRQYLPARDVARKLMALADEVEAATDSARNDPAFAEHFSQNTQIDQVLLNLREIRQAESELHQEVGGPPQE